MISEVLINNYKSILSETIPLTRINVFIGENGCGKSNILEAVAMLASAKSNDLSPEGLFNRGIRVAKPSLTISSFSKKKSKDHIYIQTSLKDTANFLATFLRTDNNDIFSEWHDDEPNMSTFSLNSLIEKIKPEIRLVIENDLKESLKKLNKKDFPGNIIVDKNGTLTFDGNYNNSLDEKQTTTFLKAMVQTSFDDSRKLAITESGISNYQIYNIATSAIRGITNESRKKPLGINGEGLDVLLADFKKPELELLNNYNSISWLQKIAIDKNDSLKLEGHKLGRSNSLLYFHDKFMSKNNNLFSAENANEGALHILFYLALFISKKTPKFFAIDNIETALNPKLCRELMKSLVELAKQNDKQALITTHNPAILDGLNLNDPNVSLFVVKRKDDGQTKVEKVTMKPDADQKLKLSELWMRGYLGGLPTINF